MKKFGMIVVGFFFGIMALAAAFAVVQYVRPPLQAPTTVPPTTAAPTSTAAGTTTTTTMPKPTEAGMAVVKATDLVEAKRQALVAIPTDQTAAIEAARAEYSQARGLLVDAQNAALPQPKLQFWLPFGMSVAVLVAVISMLVMQSRRQPKKPKTSQKPAPAKRRQPAPKPPVAPVPPTPPAAPKHRRSASTPAPWPNERVFEAWFYDQPRDLQPTLMKERMSWPPGQETERWVALKAKMAAQAADTT